MVETVPEESLFQQEAISHQLEQSKWAQTLSRLVMKNIWAFSESNLVDVSKDF